VYWSTKKQALVYTSVSTNVSTKSRRMVKGEKVPIVCTIVVTKSYTK